MFPFRLHRKLCFILMAVSIICLSNCTQKNKIAPAKTTTMETKITPVRKPTPIVINSSVKNPKENAASVPDNQAKVEEEKTFKPTPSKHKLKTQKKEVTEVKNYPKEVPSNYKIYGSLKNILNSIQTGQTATKEQLIATKTVPEDALKIVKSIRKVSENELEIKWKSKWMIENISDVKLKDDRIKILFANNLVYTSGKAIGIKYEDKVYTSLIIKGDRAYIPYNKEVSWRIGKKPQN